MNVVKWCARLLTILGVMVSIQIGQAAQISVNFSQNSANQEFVGGEFIGPLASDSANWNNTNGQPELTAGTLSTVIDDSGATIPGATVTWSAVNPWYNDAGTADDEHRMNVGYLDDGAPGVSITLTNIPYPNYTVYGLLSSDQGGGPDYDTLDFTVNGAEVFGEATTAPAYNSIEDSLAATGLLWSLADGATRGNYWTIDSNNPTLTIQGTPRDGPSRGSIAGFIVVDSNTQVFDPAPKIVVDRDTGQLTLENGTTGSVNIAGLGTQSAAGALVPANWLSVSDNYDQGGSVSNDEWTVFADTNVDLSEGTLGTGTLAQGQIVDLGTGVWTKSPIEDLEFEYLDADTGEVFAGLVRYTGGTGARFEAGDYNFDGLIDALDWPTQRDNFNADLAGLSGPEGYGLGDFDLDGDNDVSDQLAFKAAFLAANPGASLASLAVPEPSSLVLLGLVGFLICGRRWTPAARQLVPVILLVASLSLATTVDAAGIGVSFRGGQNDETTEIGPDVTGSAGVVAQANWNNVGGNNPNTDHDATVEALLDDGGAVTAASVTWSADQTWTSTANFLAGSPNQDRNLVDGYLDAVGSQPTATVDLSDLPYEFYDVYVYVGSDGDDRTGYTQVNNDPISDVWYRTSTATDTFTTAAEYIQATATTVGDAVLSNYVVYQDLGGPNVSIGNTRGSNNVGLHAVQIVQELDPQLLTLQVNTVTGQTTIGNDVAASIEFDFFEITSESAALDQSSWSPLGTGTNDGSNWEELGNLDNSVLAQFFLEASDALAPSESMSLGKAYQGGTQDVTFRYHDTVIGMRYGKIEYVDDPGTSIPGDYNDSGLVEQGDLDLVLLNWGQPWPPTVTGWVNEQPTDGTIDQNDLDGVLLNWGNSLAAASSAAVPEPTSLALLAMGMAGCLIRRARHGNTTRRSSDMNSVDVPTVKSRGAGSMVARGAVLASCLVASLGLGSAWAAEAFPLDRQYKLGEESGENGVAGNPVGVDFGGDFFTFDSVGVSSTESQPGTYQDLQRFGEPVYADVSNRPLYSSGVGVAFDGDGDYLRGDNLNLPSTSRASIGYDDDPGLNPANIPGPNNYNTISNRSFEFWAQPDATDAADPSKTQSLVMDSNQHGVQIVDGNWSMRYGGNNYSSDVSVDSTVDSNGWAHVMLARPNGAANGAQLYINGIAVIAATGGYTGAAHAELVLGSNTSRDADELTFNGGTQDFYHGVIDDLTMTLIGVNTGDAGPPQGVINNPFDLFTANEWIANLITTTVPNGILLDGDVNRDGAVNGDGTGSVESDDVAAFVANWRVENSFQTNGTALAGDWNTWTMGDMDHNGVTDFADWSILRDNHPTPASLDLGALLSAAAVPEPSSAVLALLAIVGMGLGRRRG